MSLLRKMDDHFRHLPNLREVMQTNEWSCYLYDNFDVSPNDLHEEKYYRWMCETIEERWFYSSEGDRLNWLRNASEADRMQMIDNISEFQQTCGTLGRI